MKLTPEVKKQIDSMSYEQLLRIWRFAPIGDPLLTTESGDYFAEVFRAKRASMSTDEKVAASKQAGWDGLRIAASKLMK